MNWIYNEDPDLNGVYIVAVVYVGTSVRFTAIAEYNSGSWHHIRKGYRLHDGVGQRVYAYSKLPSPPKLNNHKNNQP
jgi:hypothetical protein